MLVSSERVATGYLEINNCNIQHLSRRDYRTLRPQGRVDYHLLYIMEGRCFLHENGEKIPVLAGHIVVYRPGERQEYSFSGEDDTVSAFVHFSGTGAEEVLLQAGLTERVSVLGDAAILCGVFREMVEEWQMRRPFFEASASALFLRFLALVGRERQYVLQGSSAAKRRQMDVVVRYMRAHYREQHPVSFYAAMCHQSPGRFAHAFKESMGVSPVQYLLRLRVEAARHLLATTTLSVGEIALEVGVEDVNYFSRMMKKLTGRSPGEHR